MQIIAGIDGGGTKTTLLVESVDKTYSNKYEFGPFNLNSIGEEKFVFLLEELFSKLQSLGNCVALCIGAAGSSNPFMRELIMQQANKILPEVQVIIMGDHEIALYGATNGKPGAILIAGTGSICTGMNEAGSIVRAGGFGHLIDDYGSGYSMGRDGLSAVVQGEDGRGKRTILKEMIMDFWEITTIAELIRKTYETSDKSRIASLSRIVELAAAQGDEVALAVIEKNAIALLELVQAVYQKTVAKETENVFTLSLMGGMLTNSTKLREIFIAKLGAIYPEIQVTEPIGNAVEGAILVARKHQGS